MHCDMLKIQDGGAIVEKLNSHASKPFFYYVLQNKKMILCQAKNDIFVLYGLWAFV